MCKLIMTEIAITKEIVEPENNIEITLYASGEQINMFNTIVLASTSMFHGSSIL